VLCSSSRSFDEALGAKLAAGCFSSQSKPELEFYVPFRNCIFEEWTINVYLLKGHMMGKVLIYSGEVLSDGAIQPGTRLPFIPLKRK
jgi:hypothetical protein